MYIGVDTNVQCTMYVTRCAVAVLLQMLRHSQVEKTKTELQTALAGEQRAIVAKMEADRTSEVMGLKAQYEAELHSVKEELMHVRRAGEEEKSHVEQQLASETASKQVRARGAMYIHTYPLCTCTCMCIVQTCTRLYNVCLLEMFM